MAFNETKNDYQRYNLTNKTKDMQAAITSTETHIKWLKKEIASLQRQRKLYSLQSEFHRMMYAKALELETIEKTLAKFQKK